MILVGETNPYGADPAMALFPYPEHSAGGRLCRKILGLRPATYVQFTRYNLCTERWAVPAARHSVLVILTRHGSEDGTVLVLLGRKVASAFGASHLPPFSTWDCALNDLRVGVVLLPHPSGRCRLWNEPGAVERARALMQREFPHVPFGEA